MQYLITFTPSFLMNVHYQFVAHVFQMEMTLVAWETIIVRLSVHVPVP